MSRTTCAGACVLVPLCLLLGSTARAKTIYVDEDAAGADNGVSWVDAYRYLQDALADANAAEKPVEIRVAQGTYKPDRGARSTAGSIDATFRLINGVALQGGYAGGGEPDPNARDIRQYESILSGDLGNDDPDVNEFAYFLYIDARSAGRNSVTVVTGSGTDATAVVHGFTIRGGYWDAPIPSFDPRNPPRPAGSGGGMNNLAGSPTVVQCTFLGNKTQGIGAAMCNVEGSCPSVVDCVFIRNYAPEGGAVANSGRSDAAFTRCSFTENLASRTGGAVYNRESSPVMSECTCRGNAAGLTGGAIYSIRSQPTWSGCLFAENTARVTGGAIQNDADTTALLADCVFTRNLADNGGALASHDSSVSSVLSSCAFRANLARRSGGALAVYNATVSNCLFAGNKAQDYIRAVSYGYPTAGGALVAVGGGRGDIVTLTNCTFVDNWAQFGGTLSCDRTPVQADNCIFRGGPGLLDPGYFEASILVRYSDVQHGWPGEDNMDTDPCFAEPGYWSDARDPHRPCDPNDPEAIWVEGDYHLKSQTGRWDPAGQSWVLDEVTSPCIDAGDPNSPVGEEPEPNGGRVNMGAYGGTSEASKSSFLEETE